MKAKEEELRVLVVDDHPVVRAGLRRLLEAEGYSVVGEAGSGEEGLRLAQELQPNLVVWDLAMPQGGLGPVRELKERAPQAKVLVVTVLDVREVMEEARRAGVDGVLSKGASCAELAQALRTLRQGRCFFLDSPQLSPREQEILQLIAAGLGNKEVAERLQISVKTVEAHLENLKGKLGLKSTAELRAWALRRPGSHV